MEAVTDSRRGTRGWAALVAVGLLLAVPAAAHARRVYINVELAQEYSASQPTGERWQSTAIVSAYYRTTSQALSSGDGTLQLAPTATLGTFTAKLSDPLPGVSRSCTWRGRPGVGDRLAELQDGTPFAHALSIQWPGYADLWDQSLSGSSTGGCTARFVDNPLEGEVKWALGAAGGTGGGNHFIFAAAPRSTAVENHAASASVVGMTMTSQLGNAAAGSENVTAQGFLVESALPYAGHRTVLPPPSIASGGGLPAPLSAGALRRLGLKLIPKRIPSGCVAGQKRRRHQRCP